jgi:hypothetical protein
MTRLGAISRLVRTPAAILPLPETPNGSTGLATTGILECRLIRIDAVHPVSCQQAGLAGQRLEERESCRRYRCPSKYRNIPDESSSLHSSYTWHRYDEGQKSVIFASALGMDSSSKIFISTRRGYALPRSDETLKIKF